MKSLGLACGRDAGDRHGSRACRVQAERGDPAGCGDWQRERSRTEPAQQMARRVDDGDGRVDPRTVNFSGKAPERLKIDMSQDPVCSITGGENLAEQYVVHGGKLANVYVYIKEGRRRPR